MYGVGIVKIETVEDAEETTGIGKELKDMDKDRAGKGELLQF